MVVGIQSSGLGKVDLMSSTAPVEKKQNDSTSGSFADFMDFSVSDTTEEWEIKQESPTKSTESVSYQEISQKTDDRIDTSTKQDTQLDDESDAYDMSDVADKLKKLLDVDDETLQKLLEEYGLTMQDLTNPNKLLQFFLDANGATAVDMLIDESLNDTVQDLLHTLKDVLDAQETESTENIPEVFTQNTEEIPEESKTNAEAGNQNLKQMEDAGMENDVLAEKGTDASKEQVTVRVDAEQTEQTTVVGQTDTSQDANAEHSDLMQKSTDTIVTNLNQAIANAMEENGISAFDESVAQTDIVRQVVDEIQLHLSKEVTSLTIQLNPEHLGKVQIHVSTKDGVMQAQIIAENEAAKHAVENGLTILKEAFENQDLKVDAIEVMVGTQDYFAQNEGNGQTDAGQEKPGNSTASVNLATGSDDEISEEQALETEMMKVQGNQINYMA